MPKFCDECQSLLNINILDGNLKFKCSKCNKIFQASADDTLIYEEYPETASSNDKYIDYIRNSSYDFAGKKIVKDCTNCGLDFMTQIYVGDSSTVMYTCTCGSIIN